MKTYKFLLAGKWLKSKELIDVIFPYTNKSFAKVYFAQKEHAYEAARKSVDAFQKTRKQPSYVRSKICQRISEDLEKNKKLFVETLVLETGKPWKDAEGEVDRAISTFKIASEEANRIKGEVITLDVDKRSENRFGMWKRYPIGPVLAITPFNFPLNLVAHKIAPAIAIGCPIVLKPASKTPLCALLLGELAVKSGAIPESISILPCASNVIDPLVSDERFKLLSFTGSAIVGWELKKKCGKKKILLELGGNAGVIVHKDANIDYAVERSAIGGFSYAGQSCIHAQRFYVHSVVYKEFIKNLIARVKKLKIGNPLDKKTDLSVMINGENAERVEKWVNEAVKSGGKIILGGKRKGNFYFPTILENTPKQCDLMAEEAFGPVITVQKYNDFSAALNELNDSKYGLQAGIFVSDVSKVFNAFDELEVGGLIINDVPAFRSDAMPYGGVKDSGFGREGPKFTIEDYTEIKMMVINRNVPTGANLKM